MGNVGVTALTQDGIIIKWHHISFMSLTRLFGATHNKCIQPWKYNPFTPCPFHLGVEHTHHLYIIRPPPRRTAELVCFILTNDDVVTEYPGEEGHWGEDPQGLLDDADQVLKLLQVLHGNGSFGPAWAEGQSVKPITGDSYCSSMMLLL